MEREECQRLMRELSSRIDLYEHAYRQEALSLIPDQEYDALRRELQELEAAYPQWALQGSPTGRVGDDRTEGFARAKHAVPMLSLDNTYSLEELRAFEARVRAVLGRDPELVAELKYDGVAISLVYQDGRLLRAVTRGNGVEGDDVTENALTIASIPRTLPADYDGPPRLELRGEVFIPRARFQELNRERATRELAPFKTPRNTAAGTLKLRRADTVRDRGLDCALYYVLADPPLASTHMESLRRASQWGLPINTHAVVGKSVEALRGAIEAWGRARGELPFDTDGVVVKVNDYASRAALGATATSPRWAIAYKYPSQPAYTRLLDVQFQVGRTGEIAPVAILERVALGGVHVRRATLHNQDYIAGLGLHYGDKLRVERAGEVIPKVVSVDTDRRGVGASPVRYPERCPECGATLRRVPAGALIYCPNALGCPAQIVGAIAHFASKRALDIRGLAEARIRTLYEQGLVRAVEDLYSLDLESLRVAFSRGDKRGAPAQEGLLAAAATETEPAGETEPGALPLNLLRAIEESKRAPLERMLYALGIRDVGENTARALARHFGSMEALMGATADALAEIPDVGPNTARNIVDYFSDARVRARISALRERGLTMEQPEERISSDLAGHRYAVTGSFPGYTRQEVHALLRARGALVQSGVTHQTTALIAGERVGASKRAEAERIGVPIRTLEEVLQGVNQG